MKKKQELFDQTNTALATAIMTTKLAIDIKAHGRSVANFDELVWRERRYEYMVEAIKLKFTQNEEFAKVLLATGDKVIAEAAPNDDIWGIGISAEKAQKGVAWKGLNLLGRALMEVRDILRTR